jgi:hypothetical protein
MKPTIGIYLAGSIKKGHENPKESFWTAEDMALLQKGLSSHEVFFLNPAFRKDNLSDSRSVFGRDMSQVFCSNVVFVDARDRRGLGVGAEMMWAKINQIPVVAWAPKNSHYRKDRTTLLGVPVENFIHPFVESLSDKIVDNLSEGIEWILKTMSDPKFRAKGIEAINSSMRYYQEEQLPQDLPMKELLSCKALQHRMERTPPQLAANTTVK